MQKLNFKEFIKKIDYRHYICFIITVGFVLISAFVFPYAIPRLIEAFRDFGLSIAFYFTKIFGFENMISPSVTSYSKMPFTLSDRIPLSWEEFTVKWKLYWNAFIDDSNFFDYIYTLSKGLKIFVYVLTFAVPLILLLYLILRSSLNKKNIRHNVDTKSLLIFKKSSDKTYRRIKKFLLEFISFVKNFEFRIPNIKKPKKGDIVETKGIKYWEIWAFIWLLNFNIFSIVIAGLAYYFYLVVSFDFLSLYTQVHKLLLDLSVMFKFIPLFMWIIIVFFVLYKLSIKKGYDNLDHNERKNRGFLNSVGIIKEVYGYIGAGKTALTTDIALSCECKMVDDALEKGFGW